MRGRTIQQQILVFRVFNEAAMRAAGKWDDTFRQPKLEPSADRKGQTARNEKTEAVEVRGQIQSDSKFFMQTQTAGADAPDAMIQVLITKEDLERAELWDEPNRRSILGINDRLLRVKDHLGRVMWEQTNPGLYVTQADPSANGGNMVRFTLTEKTEGST